ncbi:MAG: WYL domain-containing protein [Treponema sp.]|nr:WYL domain-containing protein [Treponema sp.]
MAKKTAPKDTTKQSKQTKMNTWRIMEIDQILQSGEWHTAKELSMRVGNRGPNGKPEFSQRTIMRDLEYMRDTMGAPIEGGPNGYRYTEKNFFIKSIPLTEGEAFSIAVINPLLEQYRNTPIEKQLRSIFEKITNCRPEKITVDTSFLNPRITFIPDRGELINNDFFTIVFDSLKSCRTLSFEYRPLQKSTFMQREIDPYHIVCQRGNWYVIGLCHDKGDIRIFSLGRMKKLSLTKKTFRIPPDFKPTDYFDAEMGVWFSDRQPITVEILVDKEIGTYAANRIWHSEQIVQERKDGSVYVKFQTTQKQEVLRWILGQGHTVKVLSPKELADDVRAEVEKVQKLYKE